MVDHRARRTLTESGKYESVAKQRFRESKEVHTTMGECQSYDVSEMSEGFAMK
jgi:hypothetical protein